MNQYKAIYDFVRTHGLSLADEGVHEYVLSASAALEAISILRTSHLPILGVELWNASQGRHEIDSLATWIPLSDSSAEQQWVEAMQFVADRSLPQSRFAIQY